jgi:hypothetical protein
VLMAALLDHFASSELRLRIVVLPLQEPDKHRALAQAANR